MNSFLATLAIFLVAAMFLSQAQVQFDFPSLCCFGYTKTPIPQRNLKSFEYTNAGCSTAAVVFITHVKQRLCADPNEPWVQDRIQYLSQH